MKKIITILIVILLANVVVAQVTEPPNTIRMYWHDPDLAMYEEVCFSPYLTAHFIIHNPSFETFQAIELKINNSLAASYTGILGTPPPSMGQTIVLGTLPDIIYSTATPIPTNENFEFFTLTFLTTEVGLDPYIEVQMSSWGVEPVDSPSVDGAIIALAATGEPFVHLVTGVPAGNPIAILNGPYCTVATEELTWGSVKSLYR